MSTEEFSSVDAHVRVGVNSSFTAGKESCDTLDGDGGTERASDFSPNVDDALDFTGTSGIL